MNDPDSYKGEEPTFHSFISLLKKTLPDGTPKWNFPLLVFFPPIAILVAVLYRFTGRKIIFLPQKQKELLLAYLDADIIVSCPGGFLYSSGKIGITFLLSIFIMGYGIIAGKPLYILPQSIGPIKRKWEAKLLSILLTKARIVMVREEISKEHILSLGIELKHMYVLPDLGFSYNQPFDKKEFQNWLLQNQINLIHDYPVLGITAMNWEAQNHSFLFQAQYEETIAEVCKYFIEKYNGQIIFYTQVWGPTLDQDDRIPATRIIKKIKGYASRTFFFSIPAPPSMIKHSISLSNIFIGTRMHSNIFAYLETVPFIAIGYLHKTRGIARAIGVEDWVIDINKISKQALINMLDKLWTTRETISKQYRHSLPEVQKKAQQAGKLIYTDFEKIKNTK